MVIDGGITWFVVKIQYKLPGIEELLSEMWVAFSFFPTQDGEKMGSPTLHMAYYVINTDAGRLWERKLYVNEGAK